MWSGRQILSPLRMNGLRLPVNQPGITDEIKIGVVEDPGKTPNSFSGVASGDDHRDDLFRVCPVLGPAPDLDVILAGRARKQSKR